MCKKDHKKSRMDSSKNIKPMQFVRNFETIIVYHGQTKSHYCNVLGIAVTCSLSIFKVITCVHELGESIHMTHDQIVIPFRII